MREEINLLEQITSFLPSDKTLTFDMTRTNRHWLVDYEYFFVRESFSVERLLSDTCFHHWGDYVKKEIVHVSPYQLIQTDMEQSMKSYWAEKMSIGAIELLAWSKKTVEKDTGLCYVYDEEGVYKGIFCHCLNRIDEFIYIGQSLSEFFDFESTSLEVQAANSQDDFPAHKRKLSKSQLLPYNKLLNKEEYMIFDAELGFTIDFELYRGLIDNIFIPLSQNDLRYDKLEPISNTDCLYFLWHVKDEVFELKLYNKSDYIDTPLVFKVLNNVLEHLGAKKRFVLFREFDFGQEFGLAYLDGRRAAKLESLFRIQILEI